jgi:hypothetical protein
MGRTHALLAGTALGLTLAAAPLAVNLDTPDLVATVALAKDKGGGDHGGGKGSGKGGDKAGGQGGEAHAAGDPGKGKALGKSDDGDDEPGAPAFARKHDKHFDDADDDPDEHWFDDDHDDDGPPPSPDQLGRLNGFLHASDQGRLNAAPGSAVGMISHGYADALGDYLHARSLIGIDPDAEEDAEDALDRAGAILGAAANKPVSPEVVATINGQIVAADFSDDELEAIADRANEE